MSDFAWRTWANWPSFQGKTHCNRVIMLASHSLQLCLGMWWSAAWFPWGFRWIPVNSSHQLIASWGPRILSSRLRIKLIDFGSACTLNCTLHSYIQSRFYRRGCKQCVDSLDVWVLKDGRMLVEFRCSRGQHGSTVFWVPDFWPLIPKNDAARRVPNKWHTLWFTINFPILPSEPAQLVKLSSCWGRRQLFPLVRRSLCISCLKISHLLGLD